MKVITFDSEAYKSLMRKIERIEAYVKEEKEKEESGKEPDPSDVWLDNGEAAALLEISRRTLQRMRSNGEITYSIRGGRVRYTLSEVQRLVQGRVVKSKYEREEDLLSAHREYRERQKANTQPLRKKKTNSKNA